MNGYLKSMTERVKFHTDKKNRTLSRDNNTEIANTIQLVEDKRVYKRLLLSNTCEYTQKSNKFKCKKPKAATVLSLKIWTHKHGIMRLIVEGGCVLPEQY